MSQGDFIRMPDFSGALDEMAAIAQRRNNPAGYMHDRLIKLIESHQRILDPEMELGIHVVGGAIPPFHLRSLRYSNPDILIFIGKDGDGNAVQLLQHHTQMGIMVVAVPKLEEKAFRIGFVHNAPREDQS